ncbi:peptidylprolyl isomerase [soil metagenome]
MSSRRTRDRQLAKLAARRAAERRKGRRQRILAATVGIAFAAAGLGFGAWVLLRGGDEVSPAAGATPTPSSSSRGPQAVACDAEVPDAASGERPSFAQPPEMTIDPARTYTATVKTSCGTFEMELDPSTAPNTVNSIVFLAGRGFYDGLTFHRVATGFVIQGGDPNGDGSGGPGYQTVDPPPADTAYTKGVVAMAKGQAEAPGTAGSQFFVVTGEDSGLPAEYAVVGRVTSGLDVVERIGNLPIQAGATDGPPVDSVYIESLAIRGT